MNNDVEPLSTTNGDLIRLEVSFSGEVDPDSLAITKRAGESEVAEVRDNRAGLCSQRGVENLRHHNRISKEGHPGIACDGGCGVTSSRKRMTLHG